MIRYPGSKDKIVRAIVSRFPDPLRIGGLFSQDRLEYREPFFGAGAVGFHAFRTLSPQHTLWLNDRDLGICSLWQAVYHEPDALCERIREFTPSVDAFYRFRDEDARTDVDPGELAFRKLALHQMSFSGLGAKAGGPIGGRQQSSAYNVGCRWNASRLCRDVQQRSRTMRRFAAVKITAKDFADVIVDAPASAFIYIDPPYVEKGPELYKHSMTADDHARLAALLKLCRASWVLSYDDHPMVRDLYSWAQIESVSLTYTTAVATTMRRKNSEVIVSPMNLRNRKAS